MDFTKTKEICEATLEHLKKDINDTESDICGQYAALKLKVEEALDLIETVVNKEVEFPYNGEYWINNRQEPAGIGETRKLRRKETLVTLKSSDSVRYKDKWLHLEVMFCLYLF